ncbi:MAG: uncharacterized membrane protein (UPF0127 family) [Ascidiaceihabitans sp.]|jgi:uncharacterized membrane protein (UPF0127 family)
MIRTVLSALSILVWANLASAADCRDGAVMLRGDWGQARFNIELATDDRGRAVGLMNRQSMPRASGMLFVYENPQRLTFWMRNTLIPLDMLFVDSTGVVTHIHENAIPHDETPITGGVGIAVLEINGGMARAMGITVGSQLRHPAFDPQKAAWAC